MKKLAIVLAFVFGVFVLTEIASAQHRPPRPRPPHHNPGYPNHPGYPGNHPGALVREYVTCESHGYNYNECRPYNVRRIERARLVQQHSNTPCRQGRNWGVTRRSVWVDQGCRATIEVAGRR